LFSTRELALGSVTENTSVRVVATVQRDNDNRTTVVRDDVSLNTTLRPPTGDIRFNRSTGVVNEPVRLEAVSVSDSDGQVNTLIWNVSTPTGQTKGTGENITVTPTASGNISATLTIRDDDGLTNTTSQAIAVTSSRAPPAVVGEAQPTDTDSDGAFEDVNGDNKFDVNDVTALWANRNSNAVTNNPQAFDINGDSSFNVNDVTALWSEITG
jgi:hypothetical protein